MLLLYTPEIKANILNQKAKIRNKTKLSSSQLRACVKLPEHVSLVGLFTVWIPVTVSYLDVYTLLWKQIKVHFASRLLNTSF